MCIDGKILIEIVMFIKYFMSFFEFCKFMRIKLVYVFYLVFEKNMFYF